MKPSRLSNLQSLSTTNTGTNSLAHRIGESLKSNVQKTQLRNL